MGSPISGTMAELFLKYLECKHIKQLLNYKNIIFYTRYVDDIFMIYETSCTTPDSIQEYVNHIHTNLQITPTHQDKARIKFLDLLITRKTTDLRIDIYRKPTTTDVIINYISNHPMEHKLAAYHY
jgi:hypothetical protein